MVSSSGQRVQATEQKMLYKESAPLSNSRNGQQPITTGCAFTEGDVIALTEKVLRGQMYWWMLEITRPREWWCHCSNYRRAKEEDGNKQSFVSRGNRCSFEKEPARMMLRYFWKK